MTVKPRRGPEVIVAEDEEFKKIDFEKMKTLKPAFLKEGKVGTQEAFLVLPLNGLGGTVTAGNASTLNDAASACVLMSSEKAKELGK